MKKVTDHEAVSNPLVTAGHSHKVLRKPIPSQGSSERASHCKDADDDAHVLQKMLHMADHYAREGNRRQALDLLWRILEHPSCGPFQKAARKAVMAIARAYESEGARHMALDIFEKLLHE